MDRKATECVYAGGKDTEGVEDGPDSADIKRKGDVHDPGKYMGITLLSQVLKLLERVLDAGIRIRVEGDFGEDKGSGRGEEQQTGCTSRVRWWRRDWRYRAVWIWGSSPWRKLLTQYPERW